MFGECMANIAFVHVPNMSLSISMTENCKGCLLMESAVFIGYWFAMIFFYSNDESARSIKMKKIPV